MSTVRRFAAAIAATALLAVGGIALATPAQAADGDLGNAIGSLLDDAGKVIDDLLGG